MTNYTKDGLIRQEFLVGLDNYDDLKKAKQMIIDHLLLQEDVLKDPKPNMLVEELGESSVSVRVMFWIDLFSPNLKNTLGDIGETVKSKMIREVIPSIWK